MTSRSDRMTRTRSKDAVVAAVERSVIALDDWLNTYASDMCDQKRVKEAWERISEKGTLAYIADVQHQNRAALAAHLAKRGKGRGK